MEPGMQDGHGMKSSAAFRCTDIAHARRPSPATGRMRSVTESRIRTAWFRSQPAFGSMTSGMLSWLVTVSAGRLFRGWRPCCRTGLPLWYFWMRSFSKMANGSSIFCRRSFSIHWRQKMAAIRLPEPKDRGRSSRQRRRETWRNNFIQDAPESLARSTWERLSPEPNQVNLDRLDLKPFDSLAIPKSYIHCRHDKAMPAGYFHPQMSSRLGALRLLEMDGGHEVMFTR